MDKQFIKSLIYKGIKKDENDNQIFSFIATLEKRDSDNDLIYIDGIKTDRFIKNPVFLDCHKSTEPPIGKVISFEKSELEGNKVFLIDVIFAKTEEGQKFEYLYANGFMNAVSISILPITYNYVETEKGFDIIESELLEISAVSIPANEYALLVKSIENKNNEKMQRIDKQVKDLEDKLTLLSYKIDEGSLIKKDNSEDLYKNLLNIKNKIK